MDNIHRHTIKDAGMIGECTKKVIEMSMQHSNRVQIRDIRVWTHVFGSTSMGFGGIGGCAMTAGIIVVIMTLKHYYMFVGGRFAYAICYKSQDKVKSRQIYEDFLTCSMPIRNEITKTYGKDLASCSCVYA